MVIGVCVGVHAYKRVCVCVCVCVCVREVAVTTMLSWLRVTYSRLPLAIPGIYHKSPDKVFNGRPSYTKMRRVQTGPEALDLGIWWNSGKWFVERPCCAS